MFKLIEKLQQVHALILVACGFLFAGFIDFVTGIEIRVFPLYFLPLCFASWRFGKSGAILSTIAATCIWIITNFSAGLQYTIGYIWIINTLSQALAFGTVAVLFYWARLLLEHEKFISNIDNLTGLANRRAFRISVGLALAACRRKGRPLTLAYIDLDNFKSVNDRYGHTRGDTLIREVAHILKRSFRATDCVARIGGDEFVVCLPETSRSESVILMERVHAALKTIFPDYQTAVSASIGVCCWSLPPDNIDKLISAADKVMYEVKKSGKNRVEVVSMDDAVDNVNAVKIE